MRENGDPTRPLSEYEGYDWDDADDVPSADELFAVLANADRRRLLRFLLDRPETTVEELADVLVGWRAGQNRYVGRDGHRDVLTSLRHHHLPMLVHSGLVEYDPEDETVELPTPPYPLAVLIKFSYQYDNAVNARND